VKVVPLTFFLPSNLSTALLWQICRSGKNSDQSQPRSDGGVNKIIMVVVPLTFRSTKFVDCILYELT